jgi:Flp pilus assembly protein TadB
MTGRKTELKSQRRWIDKWWVVGLMALVLGVGMRLLFRDLDNWVASVIGAGFYAVAATAMMRRRQRADARTSGVETDDLPVLERRIRRGDIPDDPALRQPMLQLVHRRLDQMHSRMVWALPALLLMSVALGVLQLANGSTLAGIGWTAGGLIVVSGLWWTRRHNIARFRRAERQLNESPTRENAQQGHQRTA